ncbi:MAG TPA: MmgE/PrpD family protein [Usitatibacter sp.]
MKPVIHHLAEFARETRWKALPPAVQAQCVRAFVNWVGCAVGGSTTPTANAAVKGLQSLGRAPRSSVLGRAERLDFTESAVADCVSSSAHTFDDTHLKTITHPTGPIAAPLLAWSQVQPMSGESLLEALAVGTEIECRIATTICAPGSRVHQGWYMTGVAGGIGAAAALSRVMDLDHGSTVSAMSLAAVNAGGLRASHGSMAIAYVPAAAAQQGIVAAHLARGGFTGGDIAIDGRNGLLPVLAPGATGARATENIGSAFELMENTFKPYPCGIVIHPAIDACLEIVARHRFDPADIERVDLDVHSDALNLCWRKLPATELDAQVSLYHWVAAALLHGAAGIPEGEIACVQDARVRALQEKIFPRVREGVASDQANAVVSLSNGARYSADVDHALGSMGRPMTDAQLDAKFRGLARRALPESRVEELLAACRSLASLDDASRVARLGAQA